MSHPKISRQPLQGSPTCTGCAAKSAALSDAHFSPKRRSNNLATWRMAPSSWLIWKKSMRIAHTRYIPLMNYCFQLMFFLKGCFFASLKGARSQRTKNWQKWRNWGATVHDQKKCSRWTDCFCFKNTTRLNAAAIIFKNIKYQIQNSQKLCLLVASCCHNHSVILSPSHNNSNELAACKAALKVRKGWGLKRSWGASLKHVENAVWMVSPGFFSSTNVEIAQFHTHVKTVKFGRLLDKMIHFDSPTPPQGIEIARRSSKPLKVGKTYASSFDPTKGCPRSRWKRPHAVVLRSERNDKKRDLPNPSTYTKSKSIWMRLNIASRKSESTTVFLEIWGLVVETENQDLIVTWLLVDLKSGTENKLFLTSLRNSCDLHISPINYMLGNWQAWYPLLTPLAYDSNGLREACFPSRIFIAKHCKQLINVPQLRQRLKTHRVNGRQTKKNHQPEQHESLGHWGEVLSSTAKHQGMGKGRLKCNHLKHRWMTRNWGLKLRSAIQKAGQCSHAFFGRAYAKNSFAPFSWLWGAFFYLMSAKLKLCSYVPQLKLSQDFSKELSFLNSSHGAIRCRSRTEHRENLIAMSNPMKVFRFRHSLTSREATTLHVRTWLRKMAHNKAKEQQRKGKSGMSDIFLGAWPLASPRILGAIGHSTV